LKIDSVEGGEWEATDVWRWDGILRKLQPMRYVSYAQEVEKSMGRPVAVMGSYVIP